MLYGPRRCKGIGLSDGEVMERMWSYLRRFSRMTKEMRPSHRVDVISSALIHYGMLKKKKLGGLKLLSENCFNHLCYCSISPPCTARKGSEDQGNG